MQKNLKHIVVVTTSFPENGDGSESAGNFVYDFVITLSKHANITVISPAKNSSFQKLTDRINISRYKVSKQPLSSLKITKPLDWYLIVRVLFSGYAALRNLAGNGKIDHILALWTLPSGYWARKISLKYKIPYSTWALGSDIWVLAKTPLIRRLLQRVLRDSSLNFADGYLLCKDVEQLSNRTCKFLPSCRDMGSLRDHKALKRHPPYKIAFLGRWHPNKGIDIFLDAMQLLDDSAWELIDEVRIHGGGILEDIVRKKSHELQRHRRPIQVGGYLDKSAAADLLYWSDYLVIPSRIESIPVIFSDAMQSETAVIVSPVGDLPELVGRNQCGIVASDCSPNSFSRALMQALQTSPEQFSGGINTARKKFSVANSAATFLELCMLRPPSSRSTQ